MTKLMSNEGQWKPGHSGNPKGRPGKRHALTEMLRVNGESVIFVGGQPLRAQEVLAKAVWQFVLTGEVGLMGKHLEANSASEWASVVKWLYAHVEPSGANGSDDETEMVVRVVREDKILPSSPQTIDEVEEDEDYPHPLAPSPLRREGEQEEIDGGVGVIPQAIIAGGEIVEFAINEEAWL